MLNLFFQLSTSKFPPSQPGDTWQETVYFSGLSCFPSKPVAHLLLQREQAQESEAAASCREVVNGRRVLRTKRDHLSIRISIFTTIYAVSAHPILLVFYLSFLDKADENNAIPQQSRPTEIPEGLEHLSTVIGTHLCLLALLPSLQFPSLVPSLIRKKNVNNVQRTQTPT